MPFEKFDLENLDKERRKAIAKSIRMMSVEELKRSGKKCSNTLMIRGGRPSFRFIARTPVAHSSRDHE